MTIFFGHTTALAFWRSGADPRAYQPSQASSQSAPSKREVLQAAALLHRAASRSSKVYGGSWMHPQIEFPVSIIAGAPEARRVMRDAVCRLWIDPAPRYSFVRIGKGCCVATPEACFLQLARLLTYEELLVLGMELCGSYSLNPLAEKGFVSHGWGWSLTTPQKIERYLGKVKNTRGIERAKAAVRHLAKGAASPKEADAYLLLCLPCHEGGYGIKAPILNQRVELDGKAAKPIDEDARTMNPTKRPDFLWWKQRLALEYDSNEHHSNEQAVRRDSARRGELEYADIHVITLTGTQLYDRDQFDKVARTIAKRTGKSLVRLPVNWAKKQALLRKALLKKR